MEKCGLCHFTVSSLDIETARETFFWGAIIHKMITWFRLQAKRIMEQ